MRLHLTPVLGWAVRGIRAVRCFPSWRLATGVTIALGVALRLAPIASDPLHPDECLYASWALSIADGRDPWLRQTVIDKPPLFPYLLGGWCKLLGPEPLALRLFGVGSSLISMTALLWAMRRSYGTGPAACGLVMLALSPVAIALDGTALTDPPAIAFGVLALSAALIASNLTAGILLGLAMATKPQLLAYAPVVLAAVISVKAGRLAWQQVAVGFLAVVGAVALWELARGAPRGFVAAAISHYGFGSSSTHTWQLAADWGSLLQWVWGEPRAIALWVLAAL
ncbi:MAG: ArnT family glycosyltransferase, partial [Anaerolineae bacterium]